MDNSLLLVLIGGVLVLIGGLLLFRALVY